MPTNPAIDDTLIDEARKLGGHRTKKEAIQAALDEYIRRRKQQEILALFGTIDYFEGHDYKRARRSGPRPSQPMPSRAKIESCGK